MDGLPVSWQHVPKQCCGLAFKGQIPKMQRNHFVAEAEEPKTSYWQYALPVLSDLYFR